MMISEIAAEHKLELDKMEAEYQLKFQEFENHDRIMKENNDTL